MTIGVVQQASAVQDTHPPSSYLTASATLPGAPTTGNLLVLVVSSAPGGGANPCDIIAPAGWTTRRTYAFQTGPNSPSLLVATKVACPGESATATVTFADSTTHVATGQRRTNVHLYEFNGGWGGDVAISRQGFGDTPGNSTTHWFPAITPTAGAEAYLVGAIVNENAYGVSSGPGGGYANILASTSNDGASDTLNTYGQHIASASGAYGGGNIVYSSACVTSSVQFWIKAAFDDAPCLTPDCDFTADFVGGPEGLTVSFEDLSSGGSPVTSWLWDFGDGSASTLQNPTHVYDTVGTYTVVLTATNAAGDCTATKTNYITIYDPVAFDVYRIVPPGDSMEFLATIEPTKWGIRAERNNTGSGTFVINTHDPLATADVIAPGNLVMVRIAQIDADYLFSFFMEAGNFKLVSSDEKGGEDITISGRGALSYWERAIWLSERFTIQWWDSAWGTPPVGALGHITVAAGTYKRFTVSGGNITSTITGKTSGWEAYFDTHKSYPYPGHGTRFMVHIMAGETHAGWYFRPHQDGVTETMPAWAVTTSIPLSGISADKPGAILYRMFQEAQAVDRPSHPLALMTIDFTATTDSNGDPWSTTDALSGLTVDLEEPFLVTINKLLSTGVIDVEMKPTLLMRAFNAQGRDLTGTSFGAGKVRFVKGVNIADELQRQRDNNPVATFMEVVGSSHTSRGRALLPDAASRVAREIGGTGDSDDPTVLAAMALSTLNSKLVSSDAVGLKIDVGDDESEGLYLPGDGDTDHGKFWLGDLITLHTGTGEHDFDNEDERVFAVTIGPDEAGNLEVTPEVGSVLGEAERRLFSNAAVRIASGGGVIGDSFTDTNVPDNPDDTVAAVAGVPTTPITMRYTFDATTTDSDPGAGKLRLSNATQYLAVTIRADLTDSDGFDVTALLNAIATANGPNANLGLVRLQARDDPTRWLVAVLTASASPSGYRNLTIANLAKSASSPFSDGDDILMSFHPLLLNPMTTAGDMIIADTGGVMKRIAKGTDAYVWTMDPTTHLPVWAAATGGGAALTVEEADGSPTDAAITKIVFPNDSLSIAGHVATIRQVPTAFIGCAVYRASTVSVNNAVIPFDGEEFDSDNFHSLVTNTSRMTIPAGMGGKYLATASVYDITGSFQAHFRKNGAVINGSAGTTTASFLGATLTAVLDLVAGDYVEIFHGSGGAHTVYGNATPNESNTRFQIVKLDSGKVGQGIGAKAYNSTTQVLGAAGVLTMDSEDFDSDGFHSTVTNTSRMTIPAGLGGKYLIIGHTFRAAGASSDFYLYKNGATLRGSYYHMSAAEATPATVADLVPGDYIEIYTGTAGTYGHASEVAAQTTLSIMRLDSGSSNAQTLLSDDFNRADGAVGDASSGPQGPWSLALGTWAIFTNRLRETSAAAERFILQYVGFARGTRTITWVMNTKPTSGDGGLFFRGTADYANGLLINVEATYKLYSRAAGTYTAVTVTSGTPVAPANGDVIVVTDLGSRVKVVVNGGAAAIYDTTLPTVHGPYLGFRNSSGGGMTHDSIVVTEA